MSKEKFDWKSLFIKVEDSKNEEPVKKEQEGGRSKSSTSFPDSGGSPQKFPKKAPTPTDVSESVLNTVIEMYEAGFQSLNRPGYDFYEFFKAINSVKSHEPGVYKMAFTMAKGVDSKVSKEFLLEQAGFYINEINKVHQKYETQGREKKAQIQDSQKVQKENLVNEISSLEKKLKDIQSQIVNKKKDLQSIDITMLAEISEIDQKITANDVAKSKILESITEVEEGIKKNL
ncbi:hypothetical protein GCM10011506_19410 [Marivirga lumbricoides]|uniref:Uncharacterized protein n=1 Tax=Marivirga lumbricoides TaxID=1046115 RepID=A0ABQ1M3C7_9BACT|nr:hypothetical protein GCM10011506_19410 [Marivirga lumbricoides]